jgi:hypothetical protein
LGHTGREIRPQGQTLGSLEKSSRNLLPLSSLVVLASPADLRRTLE